MTASVAPGEGGRSRSLLDLAPIRLIATAVVLIGTYLGLQILGAVVGRLAPQAWRGAVSILVAVMVALGCLGVYRLWTRFAEGRAPEEARLRPGHLAIGALIGFGYFASVYLVLGLVGVAHWRGWVGVSAPVLGALAGAAASGVGEEIALRGGVFRILESSVGTTGALVVSAALFGLMHGANPGASPVSTAAIAVEAGVLLALVYRLTDNLWLCIGVHAGWNFTEGGLFGASVSGGPGGHGVVAVDLNGPGLLTGGAFGPEASLAAVAVSLAISAALVVRLVRAGGWRPAAWRMRLDWGPPQVRPAR